MNAVTVNPIDIIDTFKIDDIENLFEQSEQLNAGDELANLEKESYKLFRQAVDSIKTIKRSYLCTIGSSFGKDSTLTLLAALQAHLELLDANEIDKDTPFIVTSIDTMVENHLMKILVQYESDRLRNFCKKNRINLDLRFASPNLSNLWSSMFLSGLKLLSTSRLNNDCSEQLKIKSAEKVERALKAKYGSNVIHLLGSRASESTTRSHSLSSRNQINKTADELVEFADNSRQDRVFAPIVNMSDDNVWFLLRRAGKNSIVKPSKEFGPIPSYADNHRLLDIIYGDATDGSCPTSSVRLKGTKTSAGGCGGSARHGCFVCAKPIIDRSAEQQAKMKRHNVINGNMLKIRNYMMHISQSISHRTYHTRAVDMTTGAIAAQPNVLNARTLDTLITLMCQATVDEYFRAKSFSQKVYSGDEILDAGYADIINDSTMEPENKELFSKVYKQYATSVLIEPITQEIAIYLSAIHSRDGVKLPPMRALYLYRKIVTEFIERVEELTYPDWDHNKQAYNNKYRSIDEAYAIARKEYEDAGHRIEYPDVDPSTGKIDDIPDATMIIPNFSLNEFNYVPHTESLDIEVAEGCLIDSSNVSVRVPFKVAARLLPKSILSTISNKEPVQLQGFGFDNEALKTFVETPRARKRKKESSSRKIKKISKANGKLKVIGRGRTSVDKPSFSERTEKTTLMASISTPSSIVVPDFTKSFHPFLEEEEVENSYDIDPMALMNWVEYDGMASALEEHDKIVSSRLNASQHIYFYSGTSVFESLMRWGVLKINNKGRLTTMGILKRTAYFSNIGLFRLDDEAFAKFANQSVGKSFSFSDFVSTKSKALLQANDVLTMSEYRKYKAKFLLNNVRPGRNKSRSKLKQSYKAYKASPENFTLNSIDDFYTREFKRIKDVAYTLAKASILNHNRLFDSSQTTQLQKDSMSAYLRYLLSYTESGYDILELLPPSLARKINNDFRTKSKAHELALKHNKLVLDAIKRGLFEAKSDFDKGVVFDQTDETFSEFLSVKTKPSVVFEITDIPANSSTVIQW